LTGPQADRYQIIDTQVTHKLAQRPASYVVLRYEIPVLKRKADQTLMRPPMPDAVFDNSIADISVLVGLLIDKFLYHLPLYRQHQRLQHAGITLSRATLTNWVKRAIELLRPIVEAQLRHILQSNTLAMDETPIKAGHAGPGKLKQGYFWPVYGEDDEIVFTWSTSRGRQHIEQTLKTQFQGTLLSDGYAAYARYVDKTQGVTHAQCWVHTRRHFTNAQDSDPPAVAEILDRIGRLYQIETQIQQQGLQGNKKRDDRLEHSKAVVDGIFDWSQDQCQRGDLTPKHPLAKALNYLRSREMELRVFLEDPEVPLDTNHLERQIRPIPLGKKNWLFCWTEIGAEHVGLIQSLISTCKLHGINVHTYLVDVLQRVSVHPASRIEELTPRVWKEKFSDNPMRSVLDRKVNYVPE
ncbi:MAG TPA: IS66 family transposase, partial [Candidatus Saccharimonadales bacterium]|nr:IS66 family transposase [Candidatus Saccharimonadales bacterium]